jgi:hypothetical protein
MTMHQCPKCELRFTWQTEVDDHCRTDHPGFHHDYPVGGIHHDEWPGAELRPAPAPVGKPVAKASEESRSSAAILATYWTER